MGTKAIFAVGARGGRWNRGEYTLPGHYTKILGMTSDGFPENLTSLAVEFMETAKELQVLTTLTYKHANQKAEVHFAAVEKVLKAMVAKHPDWLFLDDEKNAEFVSWSCVFDLVTGLVQVYEGNMEWAADVATVGRIPGTKNYAASALTRV